MEFFYSDENDTEYGPFTERQMVDWFREGFFHEDIKVRFQINGKHYNTTVGRMRKKNGNSTPFLFAKCDRVDLEKEIHQELGEMAQSTEELRKRVESMKNSLGKTTLDAKQLMERMQKRMDEAVAALDKEAKEDSPAPSLPKPVSKPMVSVAPTTSSTSTATTTTMTSKAPKELLPLVDVNTLHEDEPEVEDQKVHVRTLRDFLDDVPRVGQDSAQHLLKFPINEKCRGCGQAQNSETLRAWLCHITSQKHLESFRQKGGRVTAKCFEWYKTRLEPYAKKRKEKPERQDTVEEGTVDLEKKKLECYAGVIMPPTNIPLLHIDPSDTTRMEYWKGHQEMAKLRALVFNGATDKYTAAKNLFLPPTHCDVCNERFDYAPKMVPHIFTNLHIEKYLAKRKGFSLHDFEFWTELCKLFPEAEKDSRDPKVVRAQMRDERGRILDISGCKDSTHYTIYGREDRRRHVVDFIGKQVVEHKRPVVVYMISETPGRDMLEYVQTHLPGIKVDFVKSVEECADLEVMITDLTLRLPSRPHAIAFPYPPLEPRKQAEYAQRMLAEGVEANLIVALGHNESNELRKFSVRTTVPAPPPTTAPEGAPPLFPTPPVSPPMPSPITPSSSSSTIPSLIPSHGSSSLPLAFPTVSAVSVPSAPAAGPAPSTSRLSDAAPYRLDPQHFEEMERRKRKAEEAQEAARKEKERKEKERNCVLQ